MSMDIGKYHKSKKDKELKHVKSTKIVMPTEFKFEVKTKQTEKRKNEKYFPIFKIPPWRGEAQLHPH